MIRRTKFILPVAVAGLIAACGPANNDNNENNVSTNNGTNSQTNNETNNETNSGTNSETNSGTNNGTPGNIVEVATDAGFSTLVGAASTAGLADTLSNGGPFTVFAPTNDAFGAITVPTDVDLLANVLLHHVVDGTQDSAAVTGATEFTTLAGTTIAIDASATPPTVGGAALGETLDVEASNGIIHVMDEVIVPPTILEAAGATDDLSTLVTAVDASSQGVKDALAADGPITLFAPNNAAFSAIDADALTDLLADTDELDNVLSYHVAAGQTLSGDLTDGQMIEMANGAMVEVSIESGTVTLTDFMGNEAEVISTDLRLLNGVVHVIDGVLMPRTVENIAEVATDAGSFTSLLSAATATGLDAALTDEAASLTVFAPTDTAFSALGDISGVSDDVIANILLHHIIAGEYDSAAVVGETSLTTLANTSLAIDATGTPITIGGGELSSMLDIYASNGIIHVMDDVIVPPTIVDVAAATADLSTLVTAIGNSSTGTQNAVAPDTLGGDDPITVFAPTNAAFTAASLTGNEPAAALDPVLAHHVVSGQALSSDLTDGQTITTLNGDLTVNIDNNGAISITDGAGNTVNVVATLVDIRTLTGVVHVIDGVLLPN